MKVWNEHTSHAQNDVVIITNVAIFQPMYREGVAVGRIEGGVGEGVGD